MASLARTTPSHGTSRRTWRTSSNSRRAAPSSWAARPGTHCPRVFAPCPAAPTSWSRARATGRPRAPCAPPTLQAARQRPPADQTVWVIGGAQIYAEALPLADRLEVTEIDQEFDWDAYAPTLGAPWTESARSRHVSTKGLPFSFVTYVRAG